ncbi:MAG: YggS family pyridoxal phosphate-dependent enzyme [Alphaproteobacteria bacterium]|nr:YggS family pyridoxal phosphate-dependent enzyme [Alphaproteobacteria bacterium]
MSDIAEKLNALRAQINAAANAAERDPASVKLIAISKFQPREVVFDVLSAGHSFFGESRVQEAQKKFAPLRALHPSLELHLIGPLQTNKAEEAVALFDVIQTLDRPKLAAALAAAMEKRGKTPRLYVEVNIGNEPQKAGVPLRELESFLRLCHADYGLSIQGLMCLPPQTEDPTPFFSALKERADFHGLPYLSMGMSADFDAAIRAGATEVRIGSALFGARR